MKKKLVAIAAAAVAMIPLIGSPAHAGTVTGAFAFECVAQLPEFPSPAATGSCGSPSAAVGTVSGTNDNGQPYSLVAAGANNFSASFDYLEACVAEEPPVLGEASGTATVTGLVGVNNGARVTATATLKFSWNRVGATAVVTIHAGESKIMFSDGAEATLTLDGAGEAAFAPVLTVANTCPVGGPLQAVVAGSAQFGA